MKKLLIIGLLVLPAFIFVEEKRGITCAGLVVTGSIALITRNKGSDLNAVEIP